MCERCGASGRQGRARPASAADTRRPEAADEVEILEQRLVGKPADTVERARAGKDGAVTVEDAEYLVVKRAVDGE